MSPPEDRGPDRRQVLALLPAVALLPSLAACGGGTDEAPAPETPPRRRPLGVGGEGTGQPLRVARGRLTGLGSVWVAGMRFDDRHAVLWHEIDPRAPQARPLSWLRLGMSLEVQAREDQASMLWARPEVVGQVQRIVDEQRLVVAGQNVLTHAVPADPTLLDGLSELGDLRPGDWVEVHGQRDRQGRLRASRLARATASPGVSVRGRVTTSDPVRQLITLDGLTVDVRSAEGLTGVAWPAVGERVVVFGPRGPRPQHLVAAVVLRLSSELTDTTITHLSGIVTAWRSPASFDVAQTTVDASALDTLQAFGPLTASRVGRLVNLSGVVRDGHLRAQTLEVQDDDEPLQAQLAAPAAAPADENVLALRGHLIDAAAARFEGLQREHVSAGTPLSIVAEVGSEGLRASRVALMPPPDGQPFTLAGFVDDAEPAAGRFLLQGLDYTFQVTDSTVFDGGDRGLLRDGTAVRAQGHLAGGLFSVAVLRAGHGSVQVELQGVAGNVEAVSAAEGEFEIGPDDCVWDGQTRFLGATGSSADLANGRVVRVIGTREATVLRALQVDTRSEELGTLRLRGTVSAYLGLHDFLVEGQRVDARQARFEPNDLALSLAGAAVEVEGVLNQGVLLAGVVRDL